MKQLFEFVPGIFEKMQSPDIKKQALIACMDADKALYLMTKKRQPLMETVEFDPIRFKVKNGIHNEDCKIYLN